MDRREFISTTIGVSASLALPTAVLPLSSPPPIKITEIKFLHLRYPGRTPRKRNATIESGGGAPGMTQLEIHTDGGIIGRSIPAGGNEIITGQLLPRFVGMNPFHIEAIWARMYRFNRKPVAKGPYISAMGSVDIALWDIIGKALNKPVCEMSTAPAAVLYLRGPRVGGTLKRMAEALNFEPFPLQADSDGVIRVRGTRITLETVWAAFQEGATAEEIVQQYPSLSLADAYQAIGYSLRNPAVLNAYLAKRSEAAEEIRSSNESRWRPEGIRSRLLERRPR